MEPSYQPGTGAANREYTPENINEKDSIFKPLATQDGTYLCAGKPLAGSTHDTKAFTHSGLENKLTGKSIYADLGYYGTDTAKTPIKKPQFRELSNIEKQINKEHAQLRSPVERCIAHIKNWKILSTVYRGPLYKLKSFIETVLALETFRTSH